MKLQILKEAFDSFVGQQSKTQLDAEKAELSNALSKWIQFSLQNGDAPESVKGAVSLMMDRLLKQGVR